MIYHHTGSKDTYITNKIVANVRRATGGNVGYASTIDMFKLYGENALKGFKGSCDTGSGPVDMDEEANCTGTWDNNLIEKSRGLLYFDLDTLKTEIETKVDVNDASLKINLVLKDIQGPQVAPSNFTLEVWQLSSDWEEGIGDDISSFSNIQATNWLSSSLGTLWSAEGGDVVASWEKNDATPMTYVGRQTFDSGWEDLEIDVTDWAQAYWNTGNATVVNNYGLLLRYTTEEDDEKSYFVKRFASRHTRNPFLRPRLEVSWENYHLDDRLDFQTNTTNNISVRNFSKGDPSNVSNLPTVQLSYGS